MLIDMFQKLSQNLYNLKQKYTANIGTNQFYLNFGFRNVLQITLVPTFLNLRIKLF
jgi:hypothetical protein